MLSILPHNYAVAQKMDLRAGLVRKSESYEADEDLRLDDAGRVLIMLLITRCEVSNKTYNINKKEGGYMREGQSHEQLGQYRH